MGTRIYVENFPDGATSESLTNLFSSAGVVESASIVTNGKAGLAAERHAFVEMKSAMEGKEAIRRFNGFVLDGKRLTVTEAGRAARTSPGFGGNAGNIARRRRS